jgi:CheY-like chemotaxis protein
LAADALQLLQSHAQFDVVVIDYAMPGVNGLDLATKIKMLKPKLPIVLTTGYAELPPRHSRISELGKALYPREIGGSFGKGVEHQRTPGLIPDRSGYCGSAAGAEPTNTFGGLRNWVTSPSMKHAAPSELAGAPLHPNLEKPLAGRRSAHRC